MDWFEIAATVAGTLALTAWVWLVAELIHDAFISPEPRDRVARPLSLSPMMSARLAAHLGAPCPPPSWSSPYWQPGPSPS